MFLLSAVKMREISIHLLYFIRLIIGYSTTVA